MDSSQYFAVSLPSTLSDEQFEKAYTWGKENCVQSNLLMKAEGGFLLIAEKKEPKDLRARQRLMATNLKNWGLDISTQPKGWVRLLTCEEYDAISRNEGKDAAPTLAPKENVGAQEERADPVIPTHCRAADPASLRLELPVNLLTIRA